MNRMSIERAVEAIPPQVAHGVGVGSGVSGLALWAEIAGHLTIFAGLVAVLLTITGATFYAAYWGLKAYARYRRIKAGDFNE